MMTSPAQKGTAHITSFVNASEGAALRCVFEIVAQSRHLQECAFRDWPSPSVLGVR